MHTNWHPVGCFFWPRENGQEFSLICGEMSFFNLFCDSRTPLNSIRDKLVTLTYPLADLDRGSKSAGGPNPLWHRLYNEHVGTKLAFIVKFYLRFRQRFERSLENKIFWKRKSSEFETIRTRILLFDVIRFHSDAIRNWHRWFSSDMPYK